MLAETAHNLGIGKLCIGGGEPRYGLAGNDTVIEEAGAYPELFIPFAYVRPGIDSPADIERMHGEGFRGLKIGAPPAPYDSPSFLPLLLAADALRLPVLLHTRIMPATPLDRACSASADLARPIHLDTLARKIPGLKIIGTGLGAPWMEEAAALLNVHDNIFFDLSKLPLRERGTYFFKSLLGVDNDNKWEDTPQLYPWKQIVFGTASTNRDIPFIERDYQRLFRALVLPDNLVADVMGNNAMRLLEIAD